MSYEFTKLAEVEALTEVPENATVLAEVDGKVKRIPGSGLGGGSTQYTICAHFGWYENDDGDDEMENESYNVDTPNGTMDEVMDQIIADFTNGVYPDVVIKIDTESDGDQLTYMCRAYSVQVDGSRIEIYGRTHFGGKVHTFNFRGYAGGDHTVNRTTSNY